MIKDDLRKCQLVRLRPAAWADDEHTIHLALRRHATLGPAHRWVMEQLATPCATAIKNE